ncbi:MAG: hypothetical protein WAV10_03580 [Minisyncoccia bacterium]
MKKFLLKNKALIGELILIGVIFLLSSFIAFNWTRDKILNPVDHQFVFDFYKAAVNKMFAWNDYIFLGFNQSLSLLHTFPYLILFALIQNLGFNYLSLNFLEYFLAIFFSICFMYFYLNLIFQDKLGFQNKFGLMLISTFIISNLVSVALFSSGFTQQIMAFSFVPLTLYLLRKFLVTNNFIYLALTSFTSVFLSIGNLSYTVISFMLIILINLIYSDYSIKRKAATSIYFALVYVCVNIFWLLPFTYSNFISSSLDNSKYFNADTFEEFLSFVSLRYSIDRLFSFSQNYQLVSIQNRDHSLLLSYLSNFIITSSTYLIFILIIFRIYILKKLNKNENTNICIFLLLLFFLLFLFFAKGDSPPFGIVMSFLLTEFTFFKMFRDPLKFMLIPSFIYMLWLAYLYVYENKITLKLLISINILMLLFPFFSSNFFGEFSSYKVPNYYFNFNDYLATVPNSQTNRIFILDSKTDGTNYIFNKGYLSANIAKMISTVPTVELFSNGGGNSFSYLQNAYKKIKGTDSDIELYKEMGITHLLRQGDLVDNRDYNYSTKYYSKKTFGKLNLYTIMKNQMNPNLYIRNINGSYGNFTWTKINPTKYVLSFKNLKGSLNLAFLYTFDQNWKIFQTNQTRQNVFHFLISKPLFDNSHKMILNYANSWDLSSEYIKENLPIHNYKKNLDGSVDIELILYFRPQSYLYIGQIISLAAITFSGLFVIFRTVKKLTNNAQK